MPLAFPHRRRVAGAAFVVAWCPLTALESQEWGVAVRHHLNWGGPGSRAGDIQGYGVSVSHSLGTAATRRWQLALALDHLEYDLETPIHATTVPPLPGDLAVDAFTTVVRGQLDLIHRWRATARWMPFASVGVGLYHIEIPTVSGNSADGGTFTLITESPVTTPGVTIAGGSEWRLWRGVTFAFGLSYSQTVRQYEVTELRTGATGEISPFAPLGLVTQFGYRW